MTELDCTICRLVSGEWETSRVHEDEFVVAFMDIQPVTTGHVLVVPRVHASLVEELHEELADAVFRTGRRIAAALRRSDLRCDGVNFFVADGEAAFQEIPHVHLHVFPRWSGDGFRLDAEWLVRDRGDLDDTAAALRRVL